MPEDSINFKKEADALVDAGKSELKEYNESRHGNKIKKLQKRYNDYIKTAPKKLEKLIENIQANLNAMDKAENANNAYEYFERQQRKYLAVTEKNRKGLLQMLSTNKNAIMAETDNLVKSQGEAVGDLKKDLKRTKDKDKKSKINEKIKAINNKTQELIAQEKDALKAFESIKGAVESLEPELKEVRINLAMKGILTEDTLLDIIYDRTHKKGIYGILEQIRDYLFETKKSKLSFFTRDTQKYLDLMDKDPNGVKASFDKLKAAAKLALPTVKTNGLTEQERKTIAKAMKTDVKKELSKEEIDNDKQYAATVIQELEGLAQDEAKKIKEEAIAEYSFKVDKSNLKQTMSDMQAVKKKFEKLKGGGNIDKVEEFTKKVDAILAKEKLSVNAFSNVAFNLFRIMLLGKVYESILEYAKTTGSGSGKVLSFLGGILSSVATVGTVVGMIIGVGSVATGGAVTAIIIGGIILICVFASLAYVGFASSAIS